MPSPKQKIIFDTSAINALAKDKDCEVMARGLDIAYRAGITEIAISEVIATPYDGTRIALLDLLKRLLKSGNCLMPYNWIVEEQAKTYQSNPPGYDWRQLDVRIRAAEEEVTRQEFLHSLSDQTRSEQREHGKQYEQIYADVRPAFQHIFVNGTNKRTSHPSAK